MSDPRLVHDIESEISDHIERRMRDLCRTGMTESDARAQAQVEFGDLQTAKRELLTIDGRIERRRRPRVWSGIGGDIRTATRRLAGQPAATALTLCTLALAIGVAAAVFSIVDQLILRPPPFIHADRLVDVWNLNGPKGSGGSALPPAKVIGWQQQTSVFERFETYAGLTLDLTDSAEPARIDSRVVSLGLFEMLGISPYIGRPFQSGEGAPGSEKVAILGHAMWRTRYGGTPSVLGMRIVLNDEAHTIVGVLPKGTMLFNEADDEAVWLPFDLRASESAPRAYGFHGIGRLAIGVSPENAPVIADRIAAELGVAQPIRGSWYLSIEGKKVASLPVEARRTLFVLLGAVTLLLLIACVNVTSFALSQALRRSGELTVRAALGAGRWRLLREVLVETSLLALTAGAAAALIAQWSLTAVLSAAPEGLAFRATRPVALDLRVFAVMAVTTIVAGLVTGILPGVRSSRADLSHTLRNGSRGSRQGHAAGALVVIEVALAMVLLVGAALMSRTLAAYYALDAGFDVEKLVTVRLELPSHRYPTEQTRRDFFAELDDRLRRQPGIEASAYAWGLPPMGGIGFATPQPEGGEAHGEQIEYFANAISPAYFETTGTRLVDGRGFTLADGDDQVILSEAFGRLLWGAQRAVGKRFRESPDDTWKAVVGVTRNVQSRGDFLRPDLQMYVPMALPRPGPAVAAPSRGGPRLYATRTLIVRAPKPEVVPAAVREALRTVDPLQPVGEFTSAAEIYAGPFAQQRFLLTVMTVLAVMSLALAAMGIFGVLSQAVVRRRREIGIRVALGAGHARLIRMLVGRGMALAAIGAAVGTAASLAGVRTLESLLFGVSPFDPTSFIVVIAVLLATALLACWWPTRRALAVEPAEVLKSE